jgi:hypothetical protein
MGPPVGWQSKVCVKQMPFTFTARPSIQAIDVNYFMQQPFQKSRASISQPIVILAIQSFHTKTGPVSNSTKESATRVSRETRRIKIDHIMDITNRCPQVKKLRDSSPGWCLQVHFQLVSTSLVTINALTLIIITLLMLIFTTSMCCSCLGMLIPFWSPVAKRVVCVTLSE